MKFSKYDFKMIKTVRRSKWFKFLTEFQNSGLKCAKLEGWTHAHAKSCQNAIHVACRRFRIPQIKAVINDGEVFLVNTAITED